MEAFDGVVGDKIDFGADAGGSFGEDGGVLRVGIDAIDEDVFEGDLLVLLGVPDAEGVEEFGDGILLVHRHDLFAGFIVRAVEGDGEADLLGEIGEFLYLGDESGGGDGDAAGADVEAPVGGDHIDRLAEIGEVGEGFAHAHEDEVVDLFAGEFFGEDDLGDDLGGGEISGEAIEPGGAEFTAVGAADLGGDAEGVAVGGLAVEGGGGGDEDRLDVALVGKFEEELAGGVGGALGEGVGEGAEGVLLGEGLT